MLNVCAKAAACAALLLVLSVAAQLPRLPDAATAPDFDDRKWSMGNVDATATLPPASTR